jgi:N,N-dimethylformamidase
MQGDPLQPVPVPGAAFTNLEEAEWTVFKLRWQALTGHDLAAALGEPAVPASPLSSPQIIAPDPDRGILAYADEISSAPGDEIAFKVSCLGIASYRADIVRLRAPETGPEGQGYRDEEVVTSVSGTYRGRVQPLRLGSYVRLPALALAPESFTVQILAWPTRLASGAQALFGNLSSGTRLGFELGIDSNGALCLRLGNGSTVSEYSTGVPLAERRWHLLAASFDAGSRRIELIQQPLAAHGFARASDAPGRETAAFAPRASSDPLLIAARHGASDDGAAPGAHFNGKLEAPRLASRALTRPEIERLVGEPLRAELQSALLGAWDFSQAISSDTVKDLSSHGRHGTTVNLPARAMTGHNWDGSEMDWKRRPELYGAMHFHEDDIDDARWETDFTLTVPQDMRSGVYAARLRGEGAETYVPFCVRPPRGTSQSPLALLVPTATYAAYCNNRARFHSSGTELIRGQVLDLDVIDMMLLRHPLGLSTYCVHSDGSGVCYGTRLRPTTNFRPKGRLWNFSIDLFIVDWLEHVGCGYDVITDDDLHREGVSLLQRYRTVVTGSHPEYLSLEMLDAMESYLQNGGRMMYLGGNGFYWRIAYQPGSTGVIEVRRAEDGTRAWNAEPGEYYMSFTGEYGGLWSRQGRPPNLIAGVGFIAQGFDASSYYRRGPQSHDPRAAIAFFGIEEEILGDFGHLGGGAAGDEIDAFDRDLGSPSHALVLATSEKHSNAFQLANDVVLVPNGVTNALHNASIRADMVFFECPKGGAVFSTGSIAYAGSLDQNGFDNSIAKLTRNVLERFLDAEPFVMPGDGKTD